MKLLLGFAMCCMLSSCHATVSGCETPSSTIRVFGPAITVKELEKIGMKFAAQNPEQPQVPFSRGHKHWLALKEAVRPGDLIRSYEGPRGASDRPISGGYVLLRGGCEVARLITWVS